METALITWIIIAAISVAIMVDYFVGSAKNVGSSHSGSHVHVFEMGSEGDELYIPGDINSRHDSDIIEYEEEMI